MPKLLPILTNPDPRLRSRSTEVNLTELDTVVMQAFIDDLVATMWQADGVGIAAPQVGISQRIIVVVHNDQAVAYINPVLSFRSLRKEVGEEGCLSVPGFYGNVKRSKSVRVSAYTRDGQKIKLKAEGLLARIFQHEIDHLDGVLYIDRALELFKVVSDNNL